MTKELKKNHAEIVAEACDHFAKKGSVPSTLGKSKAERHLAYRLAGVKCGFKSQGVKKANPELYRMAVKLGCPGLFDLKNKK